MVTGCNKQFSDVIIIQSLHSLNTFTTTILALECVHRHSLDISKFCHCNYDILARNQIFHGDVKFIKSNLSSSVITVFLSNYKNLFFDHTKKKFFISKNCFILFNLLHKLCIFSFNLLAFQTCECTQTHVYDCLCLGITESKAFDQFCFCFLNILRTTDDADDFVNVIQSDQ